MTLSHHKFQYGKNFIDYSVIRSKRLKTSEIIVDEDRVVIRVPKNKPDSEIHDILRTKGEWIVEKKNKYHKTKKQIRKSNFEIGSTLPYLGKNYVLVEESRNSNEHLTFRRGRFFVSGNNTSDMYNRWLMEKAAEVFHAKVNQYSKKLNLSPPRIIIKNLRNRWGSITSKGILNLNLNLLKAPNQVIDYIIIHELCHLIINNHSHHFWRHIRKIIPD
jgi:predicted metal-dependent hydrolase